MPLNRVLKSSNNKSLQLLYYSVVRSRVFKRADVSIVGYTEDEPVSTTERGVEQEIVLDAN